MNDYAYSIDGYLERKGGGRYEGRLSILGIDISPIVGVYFKNEKDGKHYLWLKRKKVMEYDIKKETFTERESRPMWESYLEKSINENDAVVYRGEFFFYVSDSQSQACGTRCWEQTKDINGLTFSLNVYPCNNKPSSIA